MSGSKEYWDVPVSPKKRELLDEDLIRELNDKAEEPWEAKRPGPGPGVIRVVSLLLALLLVFLALGRLLNILTLPSLEFLSESRRLSRLPEIREMQQSVVQIQADDRRGTGFNIHPEGVIVTNYHVIRNSPGISVRFPGGVSTRGQILETFPQLDLALLSLDGEGLPVLSLDPDYQVAEGEGVLIIGNPLGLSNIVSEGVVEGFADLAGWDEPVLLIRGPIHRGNSGSPVFNREGRVVAVIFATLQPGGSQGEEIIGLAVPLAPLTRWLPQGKQ